MTGRGVDDDGGHGTPFTPGNSGSAQSQSKREGPSLEEIADMLRSHIAGVCQREAAAQAIQALFSTVGSDSRVRELETERDAAIRRRAHTEQWYAERLETIKDVAKRVGIWPEVAAIIANGSGTRQSEDGSWRYEPPTYAQQLNIAKHQTKAAETRVRELEEALREVRAAIMEHAPDTLWVGLIETAVDCIDAALLSKPSPTDGGAGLSIDGRQTNEAKHCADPLAVQPQEAKPPRPDLAIGAIRAALWTTTDEEVKPWLLTAHDFLTGEYEPLEDGL